MFRAAYSAPFSSADVNTVTKTSSPQTSPSMPMVCEDGRPYLTDPVTGRRLCACHLAPEGAHSHLHAPGALTGSLKSLAAPLPGSTPAGAPAMETGAAFYTPLLRGFAAVRPERLAQCLTPSAPPLAFDPALSVHPYGLIGYAGLDMNGLGMRKAATRETTGPLKAWLHEHRKNPYPTKAEKIMLAIITKMTLTQVSTWFANARRRLKKESRLFTGPDNDNDDNDDDLHHKDDQALDSDCTRSQHRERCDSDEDINVDVSDVSDSEDVVTTTTAATPSLASPTHPAPTPTTPTTKHSPPTSSLSSSFTSSSSSSGLSPFPPTPPFHPSFLPRPGPVPDLALCRVGVGAVPQSPSLPAQLVLPAALKSPSALSNGLTASHAPPLPPGSLLDTAALKTSSLSSSSSNGSAVVSPLPSRSSSSGKTGCSPAVLSKPKIWSISEIIYSDRSSPPPPSSGTCSGRLDDAPRGSSSVKVLSPRDVPSTAMGPHRPELLSPAHRPDFLSHRLTSPFRTLETPEVRLASRQASAFLVPGPHSAWGVSPVGALRLASACHVMNAGGGKEGGREGSPVESGGSPGSEGSAEKGSPQTEALDLHTKKEDLDSTLATT